MAWTAEMFLLGRVLDRTVDFAKCTKSSKMHVFSKFERSWLVKLEPLGQPEGGQDGKNGLAHSHLRGQGSKSGPGQGQWTAIALQPAGNRIDTKSPQRSKSTYLASHMIRSSMSMFVSWRGGMICVASG